MIPIRKTLIPTMNQLLLSWDDNRTPRTLTVMMMECKTNEDIGQSIPIARTRLRSVGDTR
jgi:hypothetical protein